MFVGRERFATILLMRLTETIILWLSDDQNFWEEIEEGPRPLGPLGLQQVLLLILTISFIFSTLSIIELSVHSRKEMSFNLNNVKQKSLHYSLLSECSSIWIWSL